VPASLFTPAQSRPDTESRPDTVRVPIFFETERLRVRRFTDADVDAFVSYRADPDVARYQSWSDYTLEQGRALVESMREAEPGKPGDWFQLALEARASGTLVGDLALHVDGDEPRQAEVGFLDWIFPTFGLHRVIAVTDALNAPAARLLERAGLRREAHFVDNVFFKGAWGSEFLYAVLDRERGPRT
jgi:RimJ/RimL family protein N-acetyltransferase